MTLRALLVALGLTAALAISVGGTRPDRALPPPPPPSQNAPPQRPTFKTEANYVRVDVYPTKDGAPVADLTEADFELLEDKVPQRIDAFQHIVVRGNVPEQTRREPNDVRESRAMLDDPNARVFVIFLDVNHVEVEASHRIRQPLIDALNGMIGGDDLVAVMTPEMSAADLTFARKTTTIEGLLTRHWNWGERERLNSKDPVEDQYRACYPGYGPTPHCADDDRGVFAEMIERRREKQTIDALEELVRNLRDLREERKAVITITDGWRLLRANPALARQLNCTVPGGGIYVDPRSGKPTTRAPAGPTGVSPDVCERDRQALAAIDDEAQFRRMLDEANRANTSFYPVDPRGLVVFDTPMVPVNGPSLTAPAPIAPPSVDQAMLGARQTSLRTLAEATDGLAIVNNNDLKSGFKRITGDLSSYYLLGYYSSGKLDGKFHSITVRVKRPGVQVRARRGYLAATVGEATRAAAAVAATPSETAESRAIAAVVGPLDAYAREVPLRLQVAVGWTAVTPPTAAIWVVGEIGTSAAAEEWRAGADAEITVMASSGATVATGHAASAAGTRSFRAVLAPSAPLPAGDYTVRVAARATGDGSMPSRDTVHLTVSEPPNPSGAMVFRRGQATGNQDVPTADLRFRRNERIRIEIPVPDAASAAARLLDRTGKPLGVPVAAAVRDAGQDGVRWATAQIALAALAAGDYVVEVTTAAATAPDTPRKTLVAFRLVP